MPRAQAAEPVLDLRTPATTAVQMAAIAQPVDERPAWIKKVDHVARYGLTFLCLRRNPDSRLVLGAHPNGYVGVFMTPAADGRRSPSC
jgi:hypothetical protein